jgi:predicted nucleic acid-binding Zn ribbon protein
MPVLADDFLARRDPESSSLSLPDRQDPGLPIVRTARIAQGTSEAARALVEEGSPAGGGERTCPICDKPLRTRQRACSGRCRAELSRRRHAEVRRTRDEQVRALLLAALALNGQGWAAVSRQRLCPGGSGDEYAVSPSLSSPTSVLGAPGGPDEVRRADRNSRYVGLQPLSGGGDFPNTRNARSDSEVNAKVDSRPGGSPAISTKSEAG